MRIPARPPRSGARVLAWVLLWLLMGSCGCPFAQAGRHAAAQADADGAQLPADGPDAELKNFDLDRLRDQLLSMPSGAERDYFEGVLANRQGRNADSIRLLQQALPVIRAANPARAAIALEALADDFTKSFRYREAADAYDDLLGHFSAELDAQELQGTKDDAGVAHILRDAPPQTIEWQGQVRLRIERDPIASWVAELNAHGVSGPWLLDTGANESVVSRSFAARLGLDLLPGTAQTQAGITGIENPIHVALVPALTVGGATLHNVAVLILDDASLRIALGKQTYQIQAILGYPALRALGAIAFYRSGWFSAGAPVARAATPGARMYMDGPMPVIECGIEGTDLPFSLDTGASGTELTARYYRRFRARHKSWTKGSNNSFGGGGVAKRTVYIQPRLQLAVGATTATLLHVPIFTQPMGTGLDDTYGNLGQDLVKGFASFTVDFDRMTFSLGPALDQPPR